MRHTKILATLGPATETEAQVQNLLAAGVNAFRLNFSHGDHDWHKSMYGRIREAAQKAGRSVAILQDLQGPKIRLGLIRGNHMELVTGASTILTTSPIEGTAERFATSYTELHLDVKPGNKILIDEGRIRLTVTRVAGTEIHCLVDRGGAVSSRKGLFLPGVKTRIPSLTEKDREDAVLGLALGVDYIALSFVRQAEDVTILRNWLLEKGGHVPIVSKIETVEALDNLDDIVKVSDGVMVARGDLGVEASLEWIPFYQKKIIKLANQYGKPVITATEMLESMIMNVAPTRAEVTDIANSILDGTDVMMLSGETAAGNFPVHAVESMAAVAETTEQNLFPFERGCLPLADQIAKPQASAMARLVAHASHEFNPKAIVVFTRTGYTAGLIAAERPRSSIYAFTPDHATYQRLSLLWGVIPRVLERNQGTSRMVRDMTAMLLNEGTLQLDDLILFLIGSSRDKTQNHSIRMAQAETIMQEVE
ncbi:MAG TPA: pyruvate kinase [Oligoflexus sp.]|uniref:pyruvate kinase n=1 Tax=Oligoflexus sp. TaxID=1971216 RepID=UPI002D7EBF63|nr:pyruvate kinase [Oligoflexus sp.]HET9237831.1 pyruvate kinase [Oligoflexus sp.]